MTMHIAQEGRPAAWETQHTTFLTTDGRWLEGCSAEGVSQHPEPGSAQR
ncbi:MULTISPECIES: hypothetical protein [Paraburkholderia]|nr:MULTISPECIES: hypothetical protein [Paraburkholderia]MBB5463140.1 hypothetical protein [Paraburkholderia sp. Cpub6]